MNPIATLTLLTTLLAGAEPVHLHRMAVTDLKADGVSAASVAVLTGILAEALARHPAVSVRLRDDLKALLTVEREKQLLGADDLDSMAALARHAGAESVVAGTVGRLGGDYVLTASRIATGNTGKITRATAKAKSLETLGREVLPLATQLLHGFGEQLPAAAAGTSMVSLLQDHDDCHWAAVREARPDMKSDGRASQVYRATFPSTHFRLGRYDALDEMLPLERSLHFIGPFHSCFPRAKDSLDAFVLAEESGLAVPAARARANQLTRAWEARRLELTVEFEIRAAELNSSRAYDWENCEGEKVAPFKASDISPTAEIEVVAVRLHEVRSTRTYPVHCRAYSEETGSPTWRRCLEPK